LSHCPVLVYPCTDLSSHHCINNRRVQMLRRKADEYNACSGIETIQHSKHLETPTPISNTNNKELNTNKSCFGLIFHCCYTSFYYHRS
jgi:hypothetical protein